MKLAILTIGFIVFSNSAFAGIYEPKTNHTSIICASLLLALREQIAQVRSADSNMMAANYLRMFRTNVLKVDEVKPGFEELDINWTDKTSKSTKRRVAAQLQCIEINSRSSSNITQDQKVVTMVQRYNGVEEIQGFMAHSENSKNSAYALFQGFRDTQMDQILRKRFLEGTIAGPMAGVLALLLGQVDAMDLGNLPIILGILAVHMEPISEFRMLTQQDGFYLKNQKQIGEFLGEINAGNVPLGGWGYQSKAYKINREVVRAFLNPNSSLTDISSAMNSQIHLKTRGLWSQLVLKPLAILKTVNGFRGSDAEKAEYRRQIVDNWKSFYVMYDQLLTYDADSKKPVLIVTVRTSLDRGLSKNPQRQKQEDEVALPQASVAN